MTKGVGPKIAGRRGKNFLRRGYAQNDREGGVKNGKKQGLPMYDYYL